MQSIKKYFSLIKISHTVFALPFAIIGALLGYQNLTNNKPVIFLFLCVLLCMFFARSSAMLFNRIVDLKYDALNPRTQNRELPSGKVKLSTSKYLLLINSILFVLTTALINKTVFYLSFLALFIVTFYSYTKRFTYLCHLWLGLSLGLSPVGAYLVFSETFPYTPLYFSGIVFFWVAGFDIIYSIQDIDFDKKNNLFSIPVKFGKEKSLIISLISHLIAISFAIVTGIMLRYKYFYWIGTLSFALLLIIQHIKINFSKELNLYTVFNIYNSWAGLLYGTFAILEIIIKLNIF